MLIGLVAEEGGGGEEEERESHSKVGTLLGPTNSLLTASQTQHFLTCYNVWSKS